MSGQSIELRATDDSPAGAAQESVEPHCFLVQARTRRLEPVRISERADSDRNRWPADGPRSEGGPPRRDEVWRREGKTEPQPGQSVGFSERTQDHRAARRQGRRKAFALGAEIGEGLVDDQHASTSCEARMKIEESGARRDSPIRIVGIDHDGDVGALHLFEPPRLNRASASCGKSGCKTTVGWLQRADRTTRHYGRKRLDD